MPFLTWIAAKLTGEAIKAGAETAKAVVEVPKTLIETEKLRLELSQLRVDAQDRESLITPAKFEDVKDFSVVYRKIKFIDEEYDGLKFCVALERPINFPPSWKMFWQQRVGPYCRLYFITSLNNVKGRRL